MKFCESRRLVEHSSGIWGFGLTPQYHIHTWNKPVKYIIYPILPYIMKDLYSRVPSYSFCAVDSDNLFNFSESFISVCVCVCVSVCVCVCTCLGACTCPVWKLVDNFQKLSPATKWVPGIESSPQAWAKCAFLLDHYKDPNTGPIGSYIWIFCH